MKRRDPDVVIGAWLEDGPTRIADAARRRALSEILETPQRGSGMRGAVARRWRWMPMAPVITSIVVVLAVSLALVSRAEEWQSGGVAPPVPSTSPSTPESSGRGLISAPSFRPPFKYDAQLLGGRLDGLRTTVASYHRGESGVTIWSSLEGLVDPCTDRDSVALGSANAVGEHLRALDVIQVQSDREITFNGRRALEIRFGPRGDTPCTTRNLLIDPRSGITLNMDASNQTLVTMFQVDAATIVIEQWGTDLDAWIVETRPFMDSIDFQEVDARPR